MEVLKIVPAGRWENGLVGAAMAAGNLLEAVVVVHTRGGWEE